MSALERFHCTLSNLLQMHVFWGLRILSALEFHSCFQTIHYLCMWYLYYYKATQTCMLVFVPTLICFNLLHLPLLLPWYISFLSIFWVVPGSHMPKIKLNNKTMIACPHENANMWEDENLKCNFTNVLCITGNHEYYTGDVDNWITEVARMKIKPLINERKCLYSTEASCKGGLYIAGLADLEARMR